MKKLEATVSPQKFTWATSSALPIVTSFESVNVIAGAVGQQAEVNRGSVVAGVTKQPFELTWNRLPADMAAGVLPHLTRPAGLIGRFVIGKNEFDTFWIATPGAFDVQSQSKWATDSDALVLALTNAIKTQLTLEKTGKEDSLEVKLKTWVVASQFTLNDQLNTNPSALMFSNPVATDKDLTIQLIRRVLPCESEQCIAIPRLESDVEIPALPETPQAESVVVPTDQSSAPSPTLNRTARATVNVVRDNADGFSHRRVRTR